MTSLVTALEERREEFDAHFALAKALEDRMMLDAGSLLGSISLSVRHINTIKSGLIIHLYNIEEAIMTQGLSYIGLALGSVEPNRWTSESLREWLREAVVSRLSEGGEDGRLETVFSSATLLLSATHLGPQRLKKPTGSWDDKAIATFLRRLNIRCHMPPAMWQRIRSDPRYGDESPLQFLAERRNAIAHGRRSFEEGASDMQLGDIRTLADTTLDYLSYVATAIQDHIGRDAHLVAVA